MEMIAFWAVLIAHLVHTMEREPYHTVYAGSLVPALSASIQARLALTSVNMEVRPYLGST